MPHLSPMPCSIPSTVASLGVVRRTANSRGHKRAWIRKHNIKGGGKHGATRGHNQYTGSLAEQAFRINDSFS